MDRRFARLNALAGEPFWCELTAETLRVLCQAARLKPADLALLIDRSESLAQQLLAGDCGLADGVTDRIADRFGLRVLTCRPPNARPLWQLTPRSLLIARKGRRLSRRLLGAAADLSPDYLKLLEADARGTPNQHRLQRLNEAIGLQFFVLP